MDAHFLDLMVYNFTKNTINHKLHYNVINVTKLLKEKELYQSIWEELMHQILNLNAGSVLIAIKSFFVDNN